MPDGLKITLIVAFCIAIMFKPFWKLAGYGFITLFHVVKWAIIVGLVAAVVNTKQMYNWLGWTPASAVFGPQFYKNIKVESDKYEEAQAGPADPPDRTFPDDKRKRLSRGASSARR